MSKLTLCLVFLAAFAIVCVLGDDNSPCLGRCDLRISSSRTICARDLRTNTCRKLRLCRLREENCRRRDLELPLLSETSLNRCRRIIGPVGSAKCATRDVSVGKTLCNRLCNDDNISSCWRTDDRRCIRLTKCEAQRHNCLRGPGNALIKTNSARCHDIKRGDGLRRCRSIKTD